LIQALFLSCALALHPASTRWLGSERGSFLMMPDLAKEIEALRAFIRRYEPGAEIHISPEEQKPKGQAWERVPFMWRGLGIWIRRFPNYDKRVEEAA
jgi:hypothetical protein